MTVSDKKVSNPGSVTGPVRTCIGCRQRALATVLLRVVVSPGSIVAPDPRHRAAGRGAWLHPNVGCIELAERRRAFGRALKVAGQLDSTPVREYVSSDSGTASSDTVLPARRTTSTTNHQHRPTSGNPQE